MPDAPRPYKVWGYPIVPAIVIFISVALFVNTIIKQPREASIGLVLMLIGVPMWYYFNKKKEPEVSIDNLDFKNDSPQKDPE